ncbi:MAG: agmatine deiminase family protein [Deltaproteobacteria bacterium]|nr:agmatine deiminase family protein [Deltaproteobacteria bacterium]
MPPEWAPHLATWLTWPKDPLTWPDRVPQAQEIFCQMIEALTPHEIVNLLVDDIETKNLVQQKLKKYQANPKNLNFHFIKTSDSWIRDYGPIFVHTTPNPLLVKEGVRKGEGQIYALDFLFNAWGNKYETLKRDDDIPQRLEKFLQIPVIQPPLVLEGGSIDVNGKGSLLTTEQCLLNKNRNPHLTKKEIEAYLCKYLGAHHILWLEEGIAGDDTDGHVDDITRFVAADTIVTVVEEDPADENYKALQENLKHLQKMKDQDGKAFKIITLPMPGRLDRGDEGRLPASYANFYIANKVLLVPIYQHKNDTTVLERLQKIFPSRKIVGIICNDFIWGMGALHCVTQQQPFC